VHNGYAFAALTANQSVITWGENAHGGNSSSVQHLLQEEVVQVVGSRFAFAALKVNGSLVVWGEPAVTLNHDNTLERGLTNLVAAESSIAGVDVETEM